MSLPAGKCPERLIRPVMPELDSLRGIAILLVVFFHGFNVEGALTHLTGLPRLFAVLTYGGWTGVYLFFVLSGFLITGILLDSKNKTDYYRRFYIRRALRILPAFYVLLLLLWLLPKTGLFEGRHVGWPFLVLSFFYLANVTALFGVPAQYAALWSLAVEEQFYLLWPTVVRRFSPRVIGCCAIAIFALCTIVRGIAFHWGWVSNGGYTWLVADAIAIGALLGVLSRGPLAERKAMLRFSLFCLLVAIIILGFGIPLGIWRGTTLFGATFRRTGVNVFFAGMLGVTLFLGSSPWKWIVHRPVLQWFGNISYGLYLIHMLAFDFVNHWMMRFAPKAYGELPSRFGLTALRFVLSVALASIAAFLSRRYFEEKFLRLKDRWSPASTRPSESAAEPAIRPLRQTA